LKCQGREEAKLVFNDNSGKMDKTDNGNEPQFQGEALEDFARTCINADKYPHDDHYFNLFTCNSCRNSTFKITIEHHTGSEGYNFRGIIRGECAGCGYLGRLFTFTGEHRSLLREERPACECGSRSFVVGQCERFEGEEGLTGFFDEGVIVGKCRDCHRNRAFIYTD
jgi:hypothetical protein